LNFTQKRKWGESGQMTKEVVDNNCKRLASICGLVVQVHHCDKERVYSFYPDQTRRRTIKLVSTYKSAKLFAEGIKWGRLTS
jgi:hypothetical protein